MKKLPDSLLPKLVKYAFVIGVIIGAACLALSYTLDSGSRIGSLLINLSGDFFMAGLTISVVDKLIKRSERQKLGGVPDTAKKAINDEVWQLVGVMSFNVRDTLTKDTQEIIDSGLVDEAYKDDDLLKKMRIMNLAELQFIDKEKLTLGMFSEMLRFIRDTLRDLDKLIARYNAVLDSEDVAKAIALRDEVENLGKARMLTTLTIPFFGQQTPDKPLTKDQQAAFMSINEGVVALTGKLL